MEIMPHAWERLGEPKILMNEDSRSNAKDIKPFTKKRKRPVVSELLMDVEEKVDIEDFNEESLWRSQFQRLVEYQDTYGTIRVTRDSALRAWCDEQRLRYKRKKLSNERYQELAGIGFFNAKRKSWEERFNEIVQFQEEHGTTNVPRNYPGGLGVWVNSIRTARNSIQSSKKKLTREQIERLNGIGFEWSPGTSHSDWDERYEELKAFLIEHSDPKDAYQKVPSLSYWIKRQRSAFRSNKLSHERAEKLRQIGFDFNPRSGSGRSASSTSGDETVETQSTGSLESNRPPGSQWDTLYQELVKYKLAHGDTNVPAEYPENEVLAHWVVKQRFKFRRKMLSPKRIEKLEEIGFQ